MMWALELQWFGWQKGMSEDEVIFNSKEMEPVAIAIIELHLFEGIN